MIQRQIIRIRALIALWRVLATIVLCQAIGGLLGLAPLLQARWGLDPWVGMAAGTLVGFLVGTVWHLGAQRAVRGLSGLFVISIVLALLLAGVSFDRRNWARMVQLQNENLHSIEVFNRSGKQQIVRLEDPAALAAFTEGIADAVHHTPNHPRYSDTWFLVVEGTQTYQFELNLNPRFPQSVIGDMVKRQGNKTSHRLTFQSDGLRPWVEQYLIEVTRERISSGSGR